MEAPTKNFRKRNAIYECLCASHEHPSADMVYAALQQDHPDISLATVYRNLALFKKQGLIQSVATVGGIERFDANTDPHVHFICTGCDAVLDLPQMQVPQSLCGQAADGIGGQVTGCQLTFSGLCGECNQK